MIYEYRSWFIVDFGHVNEEALILEECEEIDDKFLWTFNDLIFTLVFDAIVQLESITKIIQNQKDYMSMGQ